MDARTEDVRRDEFGGLVYGPLTEEEQYFEDAMLAYEESYRRFYVARYGQEAWDAYERFCQAEAEAADRCYVMQFANDPITRSASFDAYEMCGLTRGMTERCARENNCPFCTNDIPDF